MNEQEPLHKIIQSWATSISLILIPLVLGYMANSYQEEMSRQKLNSEYIALAINILKEPPKSETKEIRGWAIDIIDHYSEVKISKPIRENLNSNGLGVGLQGSAVLHIKPNGDSEVITSKIKEFLGTPYGFGSEK